MRQRACFSLHLAKAGALVTAIDVNYESAIRAEGGRHPTGLRAGGYPGPPLQQNVHGCFDLIVFNLPYLRGRDGCVRMAPGARTGTQTFGGSSSRDRPHPTRRGRIVAIVSSDMEQAPLKQMLCTHSRSESFVPITCSLKEALRVLERSLCEIMS